MSQQTAVKALVLCGGMGKRLRPITYYLQKTLVPVGYSERPLLEYIVRLLRFHGVIDIAFLVDYKADQIRNYFEDGSRFGVEIQYIRDSKLLTGTGGSVINAFKQGRYDETDVILVYYGDIISNINLMELVGFHKKRNAGVTVALAAGFEVRVGLADLEDNGRIQRFIEKPKLEKPVSIGILAFDPQSLKDVEKYAEKKQSLDLMGDIVPQLIRQDHGVYGFVSDAFWYDIGSIEAYEKLDKDRFKEAMSFLA